MRATEWLEWLDRDYLSDYVPSGGSCVKFVSGSEATLQSVVQCLERIAAERNYHSIHLDPDVDLPDGKRPAYHQIDQFFFGVTRTVDWKAWATLEVKAYLSNQGMEVPEGCALSDLDRIASHNGRDTSDLINQFQSGLATPRIKDRTLSLEFRSALVALARAQLLPEEVTPTTEQVLLGWLRGKSVPGGAAALKRIQIYGRIDKSTGRSMFASFCRWFSHFERGGILVTLDLRPYERTRPRRAALTERTLERVRKLAAEEASAAEIEALLAEADREQERNVYGKVAYLEMLQLLRRFVDEISNYNRFVLVVLSTLDFYSEDSPRNYTQYLALQTRIGQEVHDVTRENPLAALVHLGEEE